MLPAHLGEHGEHDHGEGGGEEHAGGGHRARGHHRYLQDGQLLAGVNRSKVEGYKHGATGFFVFGVEKFKKTA